ncbi:MAG: TPM domain-containing protein, partial [Deltaproteobacteria bacterium]|nr:TPM domain-containing protein [Deltaproteobacteria bacterium]
MKQRFLLFFFVLVAVFYVSAPLVQGAESFPRSEGAINDFANVISPQQKRSMELLAREVLQKTGTTVVVATIKSIGDNDLTGYANRLYEQWGLGKKGEDKGVLIILAVKERRIRIETGYGVEGILPDGLVGNILDRYVVPKLKQNNYDEGMANALVAVSQVIAKDAAVSLTGSPTG